MFGSDRVFCAVSCGFNLDLCPFYTKLRLFERLHNLVRVPGDFPRLCIFNFVLFSVQFSSELNAAPGLFSPGLHRGQLLLSLSPHILCCCAALTLQTMECVSLAGPLPWHFYFIGQNTLERFRADGERIRCDKGHAPGASPPEGFQPGGKHFLCDPCSS